MNSDKSPYLTGVLIAVFSIAVLVSGAFYLEINMFEPGTEEAIDGNLSDIQKESLGLMVELTRIFLTWSLGVMGAAVFFLKFNVDKNIQLRPIDVFLCFFTVLVAGTSLFFGHLLLDKSRVLLGMHQFPMNEDIKLIGRLQYITGFTATILLGFHVFHFFWYRATKQKKECHDG